MNVGDLVIPKDNTQPVLHSSTWVYDAAVCISVKPFLLSSVESDMLWGRLDEKDFTVVCQVHPDVLKTCMRRLKN